VIFKHILQRKLSHLGGAYRTATAIAKLAAIPVSFVSYRVNTLKLRRNDWVTNDSRSYRWSLPGIGYNDACRVFESLCEKLQRSKVSVSSLQEIILSELSKGSSFGDRPWKFIESKSSHEVEFMLYSCHSEALSLSDNLNRAREGNKAVSFLYESSGGKRRVHLGFVHSLDSERFTLVNSEGYLSFCHERVISFSSFFDEAPPVMSIEVHANGDSEGERTLFLTLDSRYV